MNAGPGKGRIAKTDSSSHRKEENANVKGNEIMITVARGLCWDF
jgi:hypothetical protein